MNEYLDTIFKDVDTSICLDEEQKKAILEEHPYLLLIAGAGSGKTTTMAAKVKYLVDIKKIKPEDILVISFTNQATQELKERIQKQFAIPCTICTFHKLGYDILKKMGLHYRVLENSYEIIECYFQEISQEDISFFQSYFQTTTKDLEKWSMFCYHFLKMWKTKGYGLSEFEIEIKKHQKQVKIDFLNIMKKIYQYYEEYMNDNHCIDFDDMILLATKYLEKVSLSYKYIMVDEYQDISPIRFALVLKLLQQNNAKLIAVGDDFQSIFAFAGSEITLFSNFEATLKGKILPITHTYRNSQQLINTAGKFVMENPKQYKKKLKSSKQIKKPIIIKVYDDRKNSKENLLESLKICLQQIYHQNPYAQIALLGRYRFEKKTILQDNDFQENNNHIVYSKIPTLYLTFLTVHSAKGLGFDEVILLNGKEDLFGFPSKVKDDMLLQMIKQEEDTILLAEERRLFYVALTRTKNHIYLLTPSYHPSLFIKEIMNNTSVLIDDSKQILSYKRSNRCPNCGYRLRKKYHKSIYPYYVCTNKNVCHFATNSLYYRYPISKCPQCQKGYLLVKKGDNQYLVICNHCQYQKNSFPYFPIF